MIAPANFSIYTESDLRADARRLAREYGYRVHSWAVEVSNTGARLRVRLGEQLRRPPQGHKVPGTRELAHGVTELL